MERWLCWKDQYPDSDEAAFSCHVIHVKGGHVIVCVHGEIDSLTAPILQECLDQQLAPPAQASSVDVALINTSFLGARGISTLLLAARTARLWSVDFRITRCSSRLLRLFDLVGVREELDVIS
jgi:anti-anti-sigma factor